MDIERRPAGSGWQWIRDGFGLFKAAPGIWIGVVLIWFLINAAANLVPLIGGLAVSILSPVFTAGILYGCADLERGKALTLGHLFSAFQSERLGALILLGVMVLVMMLLVILAAGSVGAMLLFGGLDSVGSNQIGGLRFALLFLLVLAATLPVIMAYWFATPLVALGGCDPLGAFQLSFQGCMANLMPLTVFGLVLIPLGMLAALPLALGFLVLAPVVMAAMYRSYVEIFAVTADTEEPATDPPASA